MATRYKNEYEAEVAFAEELIKHDPELQLVHPDVIENLRNEAAKGNLNIGMRFEELVARVGGFQRNDGMSSDDYLFGQGDAKTLTLVMAQTRTQKQLMEGMNEYMACSASLRGIDRKQGPLRLMVYITATKSVEYYFIPTVIWKSWVNKSGINIKYQPTTGTLGRMHRYKTDFKGVCRTEKITQEQIDAQTTEEKQNIFFDTLFT